MATLTEKGQVVIPARIRRRYGLTPGTRIEFVDDGSSIRLRIERHARPAVGFCNSGFDTGDSIPISGWFSRRLRTRTSIE